jgi:hypothetical protein
MVDYYARFFPLQIAKPRMERGLPDTPAGFLVVLSDF